MGRVEILTELDADAQVPSSARSKLLASLDGLSYFARAAALVQLAREKRADPQFRRLTEELSVSDDTYEASAGVLLARHAGFRDLVVQSLRHPSRRVQLGAAASVPAFGFKAEELIPEFLAASPLVRSVIRKGLVRARKFELLEALLSPVEARLGTGEASRLLTGLPASALPPALARLGEVTPHLARLARRSPDAVLAFVRDRIASGPERERSYRFERFGEALAQIAFHRPEEVVRLLADLGPVGSVPSFAVRRMGLLSRRAPAATFAWMTQPGLRNAFLRAAPALLREAKSFTPEQRLELARLVGEHFSLLEQLLEAVPPSQRAALFAAATRDRALGQLPGSLLEVLPHATRDAEALRMLNLKEARDDEVLARRFWAYRAIDVARPVLTTASRAAQAEDRALALTQLVEATGRSRSGLSATMETLERLKNEQDPVRQAALHALARLPLSLLLPEHVPALERLVTYALEARDTSASTRNALQTLAFRLIRAEAATPTLPLFQFALRTLIKLAGQHGSLALPPLDRDLPRGAEVAVLGALLPHLRDARDRDDHRLVLTLAGALGRRAYPLDLLQALLEPAIRSSPEAVAHRAAALWLAPPHTRDRRVRALLDRDPTSVVLPGVFEHLHRRRQEWLDPYLKGAKPRGRFLLGDFGWVPPVEDGFHRWLPRQQHTFAQVLTFLAEDAKRNSWERTSALWRLARMPVTTAETLAPYLGERDVSMAEAALGALGWIDRPASALPLLLNQMEGDRARVAMYTLPRVVRLLPARTLDAAMIALLDAPGSRLTARKEAIRLLGASRSELALQRLQIELARPDLHRDLAIAIGHAGASLLDVPEGLALLEAIARHPHPEVARSLLQRPVSVVYPSARPAYARLVLGLVTHAELRVRKEALVALRNWSATLEVETVSCCVARLVELTAPEWREGLSTLLFLIPDGVGRPQLVEALARLAGSATPAEWNATLDRDQPARQRALAIVDGLAAVTEPVRRQLEAPLTELAAALAPHPTYARARVRLELLAIDWSDPGPALQRLIQSVPENAAWERSIATEMAALLAHRPTAWDPLTLLREVEPLVASAPAVALSATVQAGGRLGWAEPAASALRVLRQHGRTEIAEAARDVFTVAEG